MEISPRLILFSGTPGTGKSSTIARIMKSIPNAIVIGKDVIDDACLHVKPTAYDKLVPFEKYVSNDHPLLIENAKKKSTPVGEMILVESRGEYFDRHVRDQCYLIMGGIALENMKRGRVAIFDSLPVRHILDGTAQKLLDWEIFNGFPVFLVHLVTEKEELRQRLKQRVEAEPDNQKVINYKKEVYDAQEFHVFATEKQPVQPAQLSNYKHLLLNTSHLTPEQCAEKIINYITENSSNTNKK